MTVDTAPPASPDQLLPGQGFIPDLDEAQGRYRVRFARSEADLEAVQRLRFRVFNLELGEGLSESFATGRDEDIFDRHCQHLMVEDARQGDVIGTYRMQVAETARAGAGFYSAGEFELGSMPDEMLASSVELGRACVEREHRSKRALFLLWRGLAEYVIHNRKTGCFGCSSLTSQDPAEGLRFYERMRAEGRLHPSVHVEPHAEFACKPPATGIAGPAVPIPTLFGIYLRYGAKVLGPPAIDRQFGTIDFLTFLAVRPEHLSTFAKSDPRSIHETE